MDKENSKPNHSERGQQGEGVRDAIIKHLADMLRILPNHNVFLHLPRLLTPTEWSRWMQDYGPDRNGPHAHFELFYVFSPEEGWDARAARDAVAESWQSKGWACTQRDSPNRAWQSMSSFDLSATTPDLFAFKMMLCQERHASTINVTSPTFLLSKDERVALPFAITPFGPLSLPQVWGIRPDIIVWDDKPGQPHWRVV